MSNTKASQNQKVLVHLRERGPLTPLEAINLYGILRLASRIYDLRSIGHKISDRSVKVRNRVGDYVFVTEYSLNKQP